MHVEGARLGRPLLDGLEGALDGLSGGDLGPLPPTAVALLSALGGTWVILGSIFLYGKLKKKKP